MRKATAWALIGLAVTTGRGLTADPFPAQPTRVAPLLPVDATDPASAQPTRVAPLLPVDAVDPSDPGLIPAAGQWHRPRVAPAVPVPADRTRVPARHDTRQSTWYDAGYPARHGDTGYLARHNPPTPGTPPDPSNPLSNLQNPFAQATPAGEAATSYNQNMMGDFGGVFYSRTVVTGFVPGPSTISQPIGQRVVLVNGVPVVSNVSTVVPGQPIPVTQRVRILEPGRYSGVAVVDNDSPRPMDRLYFSFNYYDQAGASLNTTGGYNTRREMFGFEKTFLGGDASIGMRLPFVQADGFALNSRVVGDLNLLFKYAFINDRKTGDVLSAGFVLTCPTGGTSSLNLPSLAAVGFPGVVGTTDSTDLPHSWLFQPWGGFVKVYDRVYVQGISNLIVPSDSRDVTLLGNSLSAGYWLYRNPTGSYLTGIIPAAEVHVRTPFNHRDPNGAVYLQDQVNVNAALHFRTTRGILSTALCVPTVGPQPWNVEAIAMVNWLF